jgi:xylan 1,4-beta-xylosidase
MTHASRSRLRSSIVRGPIPSFWRSLVAVCALAGLFLTGGSLALPLSPQSSSETIEIDTQAPAHPFPHFWEQMFGSGRAILSLREGYRHDLREVKRITGFQYIRFHAIFHDEVGVYDEDLHGKPVYNSSYVDQIYDGLRANGVRPFVELSFMPRKLASSLKPHAFWYKPYPSPPRDWDRWGELVEQFTRHLVERYGIDEVSQWYFEVWNEPNIDFWTGEPKQSTYYHLYDVSARAVKRVDRRLRVGGPSTAQAAWVDSFIKHCVDGNVPVDFVSTHVYANDTAKDVFGTNEAIPRDQMVYRAVKKVHDQIKSSAKPDLPLFFSEYNATYMNQVEVTDSPFMGPWLANTIRLCDGIIEMMSYWCFSDVFEEQGVVKRPFYGGYGLIAAGNIPKAAFNVFALLHRLGTERLAANYDAVLITRRPDNSLAVALWNYAAPGEAGTTRTFTLSFKGIPAGSSARLSVVDPGHGSALSAWESMGRPDFPSPRQQEQLRAAAILTAPEVRPLEGEDPSSLTITLAPHALTLLELEAKQR